MSLMHLATIAWGLILQVQDPQLFTSNNGIVGSSTTLTWLGIVIVMALATALAITTLLRTTLKQKKLLSAII